MKKTLFFVLVTSAVGSTLAQNTGVNPYNGNYLEVERTKSQDDLARLRTQLAENETKLAVAEYMRTNAEKLGKAALAVKLKDSNNGMQGSFFGRGDAPPPLPPEFTPQPRPVTKKPAKDTKATAKAPAAPVVPLAAVVTGPVLAAVIERGDERVAVFESMGSTISAKVGTNVAGFGVVREITDKRVSSASGQTLSVKAPVPHASVDKQNVGVGGTAAGQAARAQQAASGMTLIQPAAIPQ